MHKCFLKTEKTLLNPKGGCMKKLLAVLVVLSLASVANAGLTLSGVPQDPIMPSDIVILDISAADYTDPVALMGWIMIQGPGAINATQETGWEASYAQNIDPATLAEYIPMLADLGYPGVVDIIEFEVKDLTEPFSAPAGTVIDNLIFHCVAPGDVTLTLSDIDLNVWEQVVIHQIPEPMTLGLLGLGGLFLRRRK
jgi:hypothetical protein